MNEHRKRDTCIYGDDQRSLALTSSPFPFSVPMEVLFGYGGGRGSLILCAYYNDYVLLRHNVHVVERYS
jgi:hypothetical protein